MRRHEHGVRTRLSARHRHALYFFAEVLWLSGVGWLVAHYAPSPSDPLAGAHPSEPWWLRLHGAAVIGFLVAFGALLPGHIRRGWRQGLNRGSGLTMIIVTAALTLTGYGLYYVVDDAWRASDSVVHWLVGLASGVVLTMHVWLGKRGVARARLRHAAGNPHHRLPARGPGPHTS